MEIRTLNGIDLSEVLNVFNESFSDYFVPLQLTPEQMKDKLRTDKTNFDYSVGCFINNRLVGFILHGFDIKDGKRIVYNGATGVIPEKRNRGLTKQMYEFILPSLRAESIDTIMLEVISQNIQAIKAYEKIGFKVERKFLCYKGDINATGSNNITISEASEYDWERIMSFWDFSPSWQNSNKVLQELREANRSYVAFIDDHLAGYIVYNPLTKRVQQFAVDKKCRQKKVASTLFDHISRAYDKDLTIINVDAGSKATNLFLRKIGLKNFIEQFEMRFDLN